MGRLALILSVGAVVCALLPGAALFVGMGLGVAAVGMGLVGYRQREHAGGARLAGAAAMALGVVALVLAAARYGLILMVVRHLEGLL